MGEPHNLHQWRTPLIGAVKLDETKELLRHASLATTSELYGGLDIDGKRAAQQRLVQFVKSSVKTNTEAPGTPAPMLLVQPNRC